MLLLRKYHRSGAIPDLVQQYMRQLKCWELKGEH